MAIQVIITLSVELGGEDYSTGEPDVQMVQLTDSPAQVWQYQLQGPTAGATYGEDNYLLISSQIPSTFLWLDPTPVYGGQISGATFILKGATSDVGVQISSFNPSLIPVAQTNGGSYVQEGASFSATPQQEIILNSSVQIQVQVGWY